MTTTDDKIWRLMGLLDDYAPHLPTPPGDEQVPTLEPTTPPQDPGKRPERLAHLTFGEIKLLHLDGGLTDEEARWFFLKNIHFECGPDDWLL